MADILYGHKHLVPLLVPNLTREILDRVLAKDPSERFSTAGGFAKALEAAIASETVDIPTPA